MENCQNCQKSAKLQNKSLGLVIPISSFASGVLGFQLWQSWAILAVLAILNADLAHNIRFRISRGDEHFIS